MGWASHAIKQLCAGNDVTVKPRGGSMKGRVDSGSTVVVSPIDPSEYRVGDVVLCRVKGNEYLHLIRAIQPGPRFQIGNNIGGNPNGWIGSNSMFGKAIQITPP